MEEEKRGNLIVMTIVFLDNDMPYRLKDCRVLDVKYRMVQVVLVFQHI